MKFYKIILILLIAVSFILGPTAGALNLENAFENGGDGVLDKVAGQAGYDPDRNDVNALISSIITVALSFLGVIFLLLMIYGGFLWMTARGNEEHVKKAQNIIIAAVIGVIIVILAYAISWFVISRLGQKTLDSSGKQEQSGQIYGDDYYNTPGNN